MPPYAVVLTPMTVSDDGSRFAAQLVLQAAPTVGISKQRLTVMLVALGPLGYWYVSVNVAVLVSEPAPPLPVL